MLLLLLSNIKKSTSSGLCPICDYLLTPAIPLIELISGPSAILPAIILNPWLPLTIAPMELMLTAIRGLPMMFAITSVTCDVFELGLTLLRAPMALVIIEPI